MRRASVLSYDQIAEYYDVDMGLNNPGKDILFYTAHASGVRGPVLELGCGTGRITLPLVKSGCEVVGIDSSGRMLRQLERKAQERLNPSERARLKAYQMDMRDFDLPWRFALVFCPFAAFTYLIADEDRFHCLQSVRSHMTEGGLFIVDSFLPREEVHRLPDDHVFYDYRRQIGKQLFLERTKTIKKNPVARQNIITRHYRLLSADGAVLRAFSTEDRIRYCSQPEMKLLLEQSGFQIVKAFGDYEYLPFHGDAQMMVFVAQADRAIAG